MICSNITAGLPGVNCGKPAIAGAGPLVYLFNYSEIDRSASTVSGNVIEGILLKGAAAGFKFESLDSANVGEISYNKTTYFGNWQHDLTLRVFAKSESAKKFVNEFNGARVVAVVENRELGPNGEVKYEAYGWDAGLELNECAATTEMADNVVYQLKLGNGANSKESSLPKSVFKPGSESVSGLTATEAMLDSLVAAVA
jgi:hypothetical protein